MTLIEQLKHKGYTGVRTHGGIVALDAWRPYGQSPEQLKYVSLYERDGFICEQPTTPLNLTSEHCVSGVWELVRAI